MFKIPIQEALSRGLFSLQMNGPWRARELLHAGTRAQMAASAEAYIGCHLPSGEAGIWFVRHGWSGKVEIVCGEETETIDLYSEIPDTDFVHNLKGLRDAGKSILIRVVGQRNPRSQGTEVWIVGFNVSALPEDVGQTITVSSGCRLVCGSWGRFLVPSLDRGVSSILQLRGVWAEDDVELFRACVGPGDTVLDVGAYFGHHTIVLSKLVGSGGVVAAFEPQRFQYQLLNANCAINGATNVLPVHAAVGDAEGIVSLWPVNYYREGNFGQIGVMGRGGGRRSGEEVPSVLIDTWCRQKIPSRKISFVKIDAQSYELFVLQGMKQTILRDKPFVFFEVCPMWMRRYGYNYRKVYEQLVSVGYRFVHPKDAPTRDMSMDSAGVPECNDDEKREWDVLAIPRSVSLPKVTLGRWTSAA